MQSIKMNYKIVVTFLNSEGWVKTSEFKSENFNDSYDRVLSLHALMAGIAKATKEHEFHGCDLLKIDFQLERGEMP